MVYLLICYKERLCKQWWMIPSHSIILSLKSITELNYFQRQCGTTANPNCGWSFIRHELQSVKSVYMHGLEWKPGSGLCTRFWDDCWYQNTLLLDHLHDVYKGCVDKIYNVAIIDTMGFLWNFTLLYK